MNKSIVITILFGAGLLLTSIDASAQIKLTTLADSIGYLTGRQFGQTVVNQGMPINRAIMIAGVRDALTFNVARLTEAEIDMVNYGVTMRAQEMVAKGDTLENVMEKLYGKSSKNGPDKIRSLNDSISYALGFKYGKGVIFRKLKIDAVALIAGLEDFLLERASMLTPDDELLLSVLKFEEKKHAMEDEQFRRMNDLDFMDSLRNSNIKGLDNGILYEVMTEGSGDKPEIDDVVTLHVRSFFIGEEEPYSDSRASDSPLMVTVGEAMPAFVDVLQLMKPGSSWRLYIPGEIAFANAPQSAQKRPIIFEIDLIAVDSE